MRLEIVGMEDLAAAMDWIFMIIPYYNFAHALFHINTMNALVNVRRRASSIISIIPLTIAVPFFRTATPSVRLQTLAQSTLTCVPSKTSAAI